MKLGIFILSILQRK